jgi:histone chaperone ASF1
VGYYVNIEYDSPELNENPPQRPEISRLTRHILAEKPRVTKFQIDWDEMPDS